MGAAEHHGLHSGAHLSEGILDGGVDLVQIGGVDGLGQSGTGDLGHVQVGGEGVDEVLLILAARGRRCRPDREVLAGAGGHLHRRDGADDGDGRFVAGANGFKGLHRGGVAGDDDGVGFPFGEHPGRLQGPLFEGVGAQAAVGGEVRVHREDEVGVGGEVEQCVGGAEESESGIEQADARHEVPFGSDVVEWLVFDLVVVGSPDAMWPVFESPDFATPVFG